MLEINGEDNEQSSMTFNSNERSDDDPFNSSLFGNTSQPIDLADPHQDAESPQSLLRSEELAIEHQIPKKSVRFAQESFQSNESNDLILESEIATDVSDLSTDLDNNTLSNSSSQSNINRPNIFQLSSEKINPDYTDSEPFKPVLSTDHFDVPVPSSSIDSFEDANDCSFTTPPPLSPNLPQPRITHTNTPHGPFTPPPPLKAFSPASNQGANTSSSLHGTQSKFTPPPPMSTIPKAAKSGSGPVSNSPKKPIEKTSRPRFAAPPPFVPDQQTPKSEQPTPTGKFAPPPPMTFKPTPFVPQQSASTEEKPETEAQKVQVLSQNNTKEEEPKPEKVNASKFAAPPPFVPGQQTPKSEQPTPTGKFAPPPPMAFKPAPFVPQQSASTEEEAKTKQEKETSNFKAPPPMAFKPAPFVPKSDNLNTEEAEQEKETPNIQAPPPFVPGQQTPKSEQPTPTGKFAPPPPMAFKPAPFVPSQNNTKEEETKKEQEKETSNFKAPPPMAFKPAPFVPKSSASTEEKPETEAQKGAPFVPVQNDSKSHNQIEPTEEMENPIQSQETEQQHSTSVSNEEEAKEESKFTPPSFSPFQPPPPMPPISQAKNILTPLEQRRKAVEELKKKKGKPTAPVSQGRAKQRKTPPPPTTGRKFFVPGQQSAKEDAEESPQKEDFAPPTEETAFVPPTDAKEPKFFVPQAEKSDEKPKDNFFVPGQSIAKEESDESGKAFVPATDAKEPEFFVPQAEKSDEKGFIPSNLDEPKPKFFVPGQPAAKEESQDNSFIPTKEELPGQISEEEKQPFFTEKKPIFALGFGGVLLKNSTVSVLSLKEADQLRSFTTKSDSVDQFIAKQISNSTDENDRILWSAIRVRAKHHNNIDSSVFDRSVKVAGTPEDELLKLLNQQQEPSPIEWKSSSSFGESEVKELERIMIEDGKSAAADYAVSHEMWPFAILLGRPNEFISRLSPNSPLSRVLSATSHLTLSWKESIAASLFGGHSSSDLAKLSEGLGKIGSHVSLLLSSEKIKPQPHFFSMIGSDWKHPSIDSVQMTQIAMKKPLSSFIPYAMWYTMALFDYGVIDLAEKNLKYLSKYDRVSAIANHLTSLLHPSSEMIVLPLESTTNDQKEQDMLTEKVTDDQQISDDEPKVTSVENNEPKVTKNVFVPFSPVQNGESLFIPVEHHSTPKRKHFAVIPQPREGDEDEERIPSTEPPPPPPMASSFLSTAVPEEQPKPEEKAPEEVPVKAVKTEKKKLEPEPMVSKGQKNEKKGLFGRIGSWLSPKKPVVVDLDKVDKGKEAVYDEKTGKWIFPDDDEPDDTNVAPPPPKISKPATAMPPPNATTVPQARKLRGAARYASPA